MTVNNYDVAGIIRRLRRFRFETMKAVSSNLAAVSAADLTRAQSYLAAVTAYLDWVMAQPQLDLPEASPISIELGDKEPANFPENESLYDLMNLYDALEVEIGNSQSARMSTGLISHDEKRARDIILKMENFLASYVSSVLPLDLPESAPLRANTGAGRTGV